MRETPTQSARIWWFAGWLLLASAINYMDRQTLVIVAVRISREFHRSHEQCGNVEVGFA